MENWEVSFKKEISQAQSSRLEGNEGRSRVCARRAVGILIGEYLLRQGYNTIPNSAMDRLVFFRNLNQQDTVIAKLLDHFIMQVTSEHTLPDSIDLISEALQLVEILNLTESL